MKLPFTQSADGISFTVAVDEHPVDPRECDQATSTMLCWCKRHILGDVQASREFDISQYAGWDELEQAVRKKYKPVVLEPLYLMDHGDVTIRTKPFHCPWDSGQIGFILVTFAQVTKYAGRRLRHASDKEHYAQRSIKNAVDNYNRYLSGEQYRFEVWDDTAGKILDACCGFDTPEAAHEAALDAMRTALAGRYKQLEFNYGSVQAAPAAT